MTEIKTGTLIKTKTLVKTALLCLTLGSGYSFADCSSPTAPTIPDGKTASMDEMLASKKAIGDFQAANTEYLGCMDKKMAAVKATTAEGSAEDMAKAQAQMGKLTDDYNKSVDTEKALAEQFNSAIREFKAAAKK
ncbi:hypothetical protein [Pseudomaricurvus hydrocarbonicus]|uniref:hypothetical protein n=1 Tax=Pseudomaricurvus hydrocarbonicus TaxID=1470433 RepID=UPI001AA013EA|nr:hypothetical protein [Aestuariicella hydrocarbonica]